ncbi:MAG: flagellar export protein FliJ [Steroidobacteraceae bacterium]
MKRSDRMAPVQQVLSDTEQARARDLGAAQQRLAEAEAKLGELKNYHADYQRAFLARGQQGHAVTALRDFQAFLARLEEALRQQDRAVVMARDQVSLQRRNWQGAARQVKAVESVVQRWQNAEARAVDRREQKETDERAQRSVSRGGLA